VVVDTADGSHYQPAPRTFLPPDCDDHVPVDRTRAVDPGTARRSRCESGRRRQIPNDAVPVEGARTPSVRSRSPYSTRRGRAGLVQTRFSAVHPEERGSATGRQQPDSHRHVTGADGEPQV
jgi:hypothetical protein